MPKLNIQKQTLDINLINYEKRLQEDIKNKLEKSDNLEFFNKFSKLSHQKYIVQITKDYENMELGLRILESNINIIRSQIEAEKSNRDRNFQTLVTVIGTGTAVTSLIDYEGKKCEAIFQLIPVTTHWCNNSLTKTILFPVVMILIFGIIGLGFKKLFSK
ncbi:hypothetical protein [Crocosphaera sp. XPORK-15E]|uniref:hypothetical protein n=1 Tax=Crocosphaera sp. XPORK-15E TaxID=3110247 RepID=UPI002B21C268|nr:hypothetical protein [Crocosphaera sp. XPORK-15E]MEA5533869.1 hypothetical protein [Crocosphaera sp. XPORK-15E]